MLSSSPDQTLRHPLNTSVSKYHWSFSRASRFQEKQAKYSQFSLNVAPYDVPPAFNKLSFSFGKETRQPFRAQSKRYIDASPAPGTYAPPRDFDGKGTGWSFGKDTAILRGTLSGKESPGPGAYSIVPGDFGKEGRKFTLRPKTSSPGTRYVDGKRNRDIPGPGTYEPKDSLDISGAYTISKYRNYKAMGFTARHVRTQSTGATPGPGAYQPHTDMSQTGDYFIAAFKSSQSRRFGKADSRPGSVARSCAPGPGTYDLPSDFGIYSTPLSTRAPSRKSGRG